MKSSAQLPVVYARYISTINLEDYKTKLNQPNGTHPSKQCGPAMGSFLACYLQAKVINVDEPAALNQLQADREHIITLINDKKCEINFENEKQLANVFEQLRTKLDLYRELTGAAFLKTTLQCSNGDTFLHHFLTKLNLANEAELQAAISLIKQDSTLVSVKGEAGHPITLIMNKIMEAMSNAETKASICYSQLIELLGLCQATENKVQLTHAEISFLLKSCFTLLEQSADSRVVKLGFEAAIAAASLGMPLHQSMKGCADGQTALFAYVMELDSAHEWGVEPMRRLLSVATPEVAKLQVKVNPEAVTIERIGDGDPENPSRCVYLEGEDLPSREESVAKAARKDLRDEVLDLEIASQFFKPSVVVNALEEKEGLDGIECYQVDGLLFYSDYKLLAHNRDYMQNHPCVRLFLSLLSESKLPKSLSKYREATDRRLWVLSQHEQTGFNVSPQSRRFRLYQRERSYSSYWVSSTTAPDKVPSHLNYLLSDGPKKKSIFDEINEAWQNPANRKKIMNYYHAYSMRPSETITKKNALLVYLEKGQSVGLALSSLAAYITQREFAFKSSKDPRLVRFSPGQIQLTSIYKSQQGEFLLRPFSEKGKSISQVRVYDFEVIKWFKKLGFDFSTPEVTTWMEKMISQEAFSPALYELLACLKECGAVFPKTIASDSCGDYITNKLVQVTEDASVEWFQLYGFDDEQFAHVVSAHKLALGFAAGDEITPQAYRNKFCEAFYELHQPKKDYVKLLRQWLNGIKFRESDSKPVGEYAGMMASLEAYIQSGNYEDEYLEKGDLYFNFFFEVIKARLTHLSSKIDEAVNHIPASKNSLFAKAAVLARAAKVGNKLKSIQLHISEIISTTPTPRGREERVRTISIYKAVNDAVERVLSNKAIDSEKVNLCFEQYLDGRMFAGEIDLNDSTWVGLVRDITPEDLQEKIAPFFITNEQRQQAFYDRPNAPMAAPGEDDSTYQPPMTHKGELIECPEPVSDEVIPQAIYPSVPAQAQPADSFQARCEQYKAAVSALPSDGNPDDLVASLNEQIVSITDNSVMPMHLLPALKMMICRDTGKFTRYPCMIDQNPMAYYDLDHLLNVLQKSQAIDGVEGVLTEDRISFRSASEVFLMLGMLQTAKAQLELMAVADVGVAYRPGM